MAKGYWVARIDVHDLDGYKRDYVAHNGAVFKKYGAKFLVRGGTHEAHEGPARSRNVVIEFKDYATALACYHSPDRTPTARSSSSRAMTASSRKNLKASRA